ncbi:transcription initiation factor IIB-like [Papaver somniferum]|uniref:transcription initiation factor IIB-like n=1 Tax=Papaver somniferum TaxID=3469 RepID=UPI000E6FFD52|nr:transcription initiation factor IIB-like [Papaver somniferum]
MEESYCSDCKSVTAVISDHSTGDTICCDCGLVLEDHLIDETSEWRTFADEPANNDPHRVGDKSNPLLSNNGLTTLISMPNKGGEYPSSNSFRRFNQANMKDPDKGLIEAFRRLRRCLTDWVLFLL